jgi:hypothetical protein
MHDEAQKRCAIGPFLHPLDKPHEELNKFIAEREDQDAKSQNQQSQANFRQIFAPVCLPQMVRDRLLSLEGGALLLCVVLVVIALAAYFLLILSSEGMWEKTHF